MKKLLIITGDMAAGKSAFAQTLAERYQAAVFQKDKIKEILGDMLGFSSREENLKLSHAAIEIMEHIFETLAKTGESLILEANYHEDEQKRLCELAERYEYQVLTLLIQGDVDVLYQRYMHRIKEENRHPVHLSTTFHIQADFNAAIMNARSELMSGETIKANASDFSYQTDGNLLSILDRFMK